MTHYFVQIKEKNKTHKILCHTYNKEKDEYYHKFKDKKKALVLIEQEKVTHPDTTKFRVVKCVEKYELSDWV